MVTQGDDVETKEKVLRILYEEGKSISGEAIASRLGISRNSVWKAVNSLKASGYIITATSEGYCIEDGNVFDEYSIKQHLTREHKLHLYKKESSSNLIAKQLCQNGEEHGSVVIVESQTEGRGRMGRSFLSSSENGLYLSVILRPKISIDKCLSVTVAAAVAVATAIEETSGVECGIKWVNDIYINNKKCAGILTEATMDFESSSVQYIVVGIGVNISPPTEGFHKDIEEIACGVYEKGYPQGYKAKLCAKIIDNLFDLYDELEGKKYFEIYKSKSIIIGKEVDVYVGDSVMCGTAIDIDENANLIVVDNEGTRHTVNSGDARVRQANDKRGIL